MDQAELDKSMKLLELVENYVTYVVASSYLPDSASTPVKRASNIGPRGLISYIRARARARIVRSINAKNVNCHVCSIPFAFVWSQTVANLQPYCMDRKSAK